MNRIYRPLITALLLIGQIFAQSGNDAAPLSRKVEDLISQMTLEEKVGQMTQVTLQVISAQRGWLDSEHRLDPQKLDTAIVHKHVGSILNVFDKAHSLAYWHEVITQIQDVATKKTRLGIPVIYGIDAIHGANYTKEATLFPQSLAMAATRNPELVRKSAEITAYEVRASGIPWNFNPVLDVGRNPLWPRLWETFGEDPYLVSQLGEAYVLGLQGGNPPTFGKAQVAACLKHYVGYSFPLSGKDRTPAWIPERMLREYFLPPFQTAVAAGAPTVMVNSAEINGIPLHSDGYLINQVLKDEMGFEGFVVSDWEDIKRLHTRDKVAATPREAVKMAVLAGLDMSMVPYDFSFYDLLLDLVKTGEVPQSRIDDAVRRILTVKYRLGLFENPYPDKTMAAAVGSESSVALSRQAAREALTLLKNEGDLLPLAKNRKVFVTGPTANLLSVLNGGWTYTWQGAEEPLYPQEKQTVLEAIQEKIGAENVTYLPGSEYDRPVDIAAAAAAAAQAEVAVVCLGEMPYCESPGNIHDLTLPRAQLDLVRAIQETGTPVVLVLIEGRPRIITPVVEKSDAILMAYLPGPEGGGAIADVLFGDFNPCGKLPITYPRHPNDLVCYDHKPIEMDDPGKLNPLWEFGHGLSYTRFAYSDLTLSPAQLQPGQPLTVRVRVSNTGQRAGKALVELYLSDLVRSVSPPVRQLRRFTGVMLQPGESQTLTFKLNETDFAFFDRQNRKVVEPGEFRVTIGDQSGTFTLALAME